MCSPRMFSIALRFNLICFAVSPPLRTCTCGPKGEALHLFYFGEPPQFQLFFCNGPIKLAHCRKQKVGVVRHPQLINLKHNKYPQFQFFLCWSLQETCQSFEIKNPPTLVNNNNNNNNNKLCLFCSTQYLIRIKFQSILFFFNREIFNFSDNDFIGASLGEMGYRHMSYKKTILNCKFIRG